MLRLQLDNLELFRQSLQRVTAKPGFYDGFYHNFIDQSEEITALFRNRDMPQLKRKLRNTLQMLVETVEGKPGLELYIEMLGRVHRRLNIQRRHFTMWEDALLEAVRVYDEEYSKQVLAAWLLVIGMVAERMFIALDGVEKVAF
ncbi:MAG: globin [Candidatus Thiodiazotropha sp. (ex Epidulcina cf. delphinae)]|nr:globin [Candidatus Thiodiazotropha sp. (ex Epidulcina cf. delphinae)]